MNSEVILIYALKSTVVTAILYAYYLIALRDNKFHYYNRFYLLGSLILSLTIPFLDLHWFTFERPVTESTNLELIQLITAPSNQIIENQFGWTDGILIGAGIIAFIFLAMLLISVWKIFSLKRNSPIRYLDGIDFIETEVDNAPFSFLNNLFWKKTMSLEDDKGQKIFKHELTHIRQKHSWDRLFCQVLSSIFWINPFNWIIQKELQTIHEFIADEEAIGNQNTEAFAKLLLETHYGTHFLNPIHPFNYSSIKRRLAMLTKSNKTEYSYLRRVMALPIMLIALAIFSIKVNAVNRIQNLENKIEEAFIEIQADTIKKKSSNDKTTVILEKVNGDKGKEVKKIVIIDGKTTISDLKPEDIESIRLIKKDGVKLEREAKDLKELAVKGYTIIADSVVFKNDKNNDIMIITTKSKNGKDQSVYMVDPSDKSESKKLYIINPSDVIEIEKLGEKVKNLKGEKLSQSDGRAEKLRIELEFRAEKPETKLSGSNKDINDAVYMIDGKIVDGSAFKNLNPSDIQSVSVLKGENAEKKYGDLKGKGVIEIITKKK
ncbi:M56 family metallopeptidase [Daejeonella sp.]|uniref:M56 family metallopeptidase n=1 Tax=Daejeonella sp. TaxID=2805397 RepID=UPI0025BE3D22|nr:M56 family metallopeptidase [Daejeonella sp.]